MFGLAALVSFLLGGLATLLGEVAIGLALLNRAEGAVARVQYDLQSALSAFGANVDSFLAGLR